MVSIEQEDDAPLPDIIGNLTIGDIQTAESFVSSQIRSHPLVRRIQLPAHSCTPTAHFHAHEDVVTMNDHTILETVQRWRRKKYSARPFYLTLLAIGLITLLAIAKDYRSHVQVRSEPQLFRRDLVIQDEEVCTTYTWADM